MQKCALALGVLLVIGCGKPSSEPSQTASAPKTTSADVLDGEPVKPPFAVRGEGEGLLLVWYDAEGAPHSARKRSEIPEAQRSHVRVDSLEVPPDKRLDAAFMYVADMRAAGDDGSYPVRKVKRAAFEQAITKPSANEQVAAAAGGEVILYSTSWCGVCKAAARYFRQKGVPFIEKDIEKEPGAREEMLAKARAQGVSASGVPVIDIKGRLLAGFEPSAVERLLAAP